MFFHELLVWLVRYYISNDKVGGKEEVCSFK